jgi:predicted nucleic acid-binding protein
VTPPYALDTSALLAHFLKEPEWEIVEGLLEKEADAVHINTVAWLEFQIRLSERIRM